MPKGMLKTGLSSLEQVIGIQSTVTSGAGTQSGPSPTKETRWDVLNGGDR